MSWSGRRRGASAVHWAAALTVGALGLAGCAGAQAAEAAFATDFECGSASAKESESPGRYVVTGCGRRASYVCGSNGVCALQTSEAPSASERRATYAPPRPATASSEKKVENPEDGDVMVLELVLDGKALLRLTAVPDKHADVVSASGRS